MHRHRQAPMWCCAQNGQSLDACPEGELCSALVSLAVPSLYGAQDLLASASWAALTTSSFQVGLLNTCP